jgi:hypothetical protein
MEADKMRNAGDVVPAIMTNVLWWLESGKIVTNIGAGPRPQVRSSIE